MPQHLLPYSVVPKIDVATIQIWPLIIAHKQSLLSYFINCGLTYVRRLFEVQFNQVN